MSGDYYGRPSDHRRRDGSNYPPARPASVHRQSVDYSDYPPARPASVHRQSVDYSDYPPARPASVRRPSATYDRHDYFDSSRSAPKPNYPPKASRPYEQPPPRRRASSKDQDRPRTRDGGGADRRSLYGDRPPTREGRARDRPVPIPPSGARAPRAASVGGGGSGVDYVYTQPPTFDTRYATPLYDNRAEQADTRRDRRRDDRKSQPKKPHWWNSGKLKGAAKNVGGKAINVSAEAGRGVLDNLLAEEQFKIDTKIEEDHHARVGGVVDGVSKLGSGLLRGLLKSSKKGKKKHHEHGGRRRRYSG